MDPTSAQALIRTWLSRLQRTNNPDSLIRAVRKIFSYVQVFSSASWCIVDPFKPVSKAYATGHAHCKTVHISNLVQFFLACSWFPVSLGKTVHLKLSSLNETGRIGWFLWAFPYVTDCNSMILMNQKLHHQYSQCDWDQAHFCLWLMKSSPLFKNHTLCTNC